MPTRPTDPRAVVLCAAIVVAALCPSASSAQATQGIALFIQHCGACHDAPAADSRAPNRDALRQRTPEAVLEALTTGSMAVNAQALTDQQKRIIAEQLTLRPLGAAAAGAATTMKNRCEASKFGDPAKGPSWSGWGADVANTRFQPAAAAGLDAARVPKLALKWSFAFPSGASAYGQPAVAGGRVFVGSDNGYVYALGASTGCVHWAFHTQAGVRTAISVGPVSRGGAAAHAVYFGDLKGYVYALDAETGAEIWNVHVDDHPLARVTGAPTLHAGRLYVPLSSLEEAAGSNPRYACCTFRGGVVAYDAQTGRQVWKTYVIPEPPKPTKKNSMGTQLWGPAGGAIWSSPTVDVARGVLYVGTGNGYTEPAHETTDAIVAMDLKTGAIRWTRQLTPRDAFVIGCGPTAATRDNCPDDTGPDVDFGNSPILRRLADGRSVLAAGQKSGVAWGLDPDKKGEVIWQRRVGKGSALGGLEWGSAADEQLGFFPVADAQYGPTEAGGLFALRLSNGEQVWSTRPPPVECKPNDRTCAVQSQSAAISVIPGVVFSGATNGMMRAYSTADGRVIWEYNTVREYTTVNGVAGKGGSINGPGPVIAGGMVYFNSGYAYLGGGIPGNVLLAFGVE